MRSTYKKVSGMTAEIKIRRCYGCGSLLQSQDRFEAGLYPRNVKEMMKVFVIAVSTSVTHHKAQIKPWIMILRSF